LKFIETTTGASDWAMTGFGAKGMNDNAKSVNKKILRIRFVFIVSL
jgi:hypothetical protein